MKSRTVLFFMALLLWLGLAFPPGWEEVAAGIVAAALVAALTGDMFAGRPHQFGEIKRYLWFAWYVPVFLWECLKANIDVARRVADPRLPIRPGIVKIKTRLKSDSGLTFLANSITLTPGTLAVDVDREEGVIYIHWIWVKTQDSEEATRMISAKFENILARIFE